MNRVIKCREQDCLTCKQFACPYGRQVRDQEKIKTFLGEYAVRESDHYAPLGTIVRRARC
jgi:hypothetical protein